MAIAGVRKIPIGLGAYASQLANKSAAETYDNTTDSLEAIADALSRALFTMDFWSVPTGALGATPGVAIATIALPGVDVFGIPVGATVVKACCIFKVRTLTETSAADNYLSGAQFIQIQKGGVGGYVNAISLADSQFYTTASAIDSPGDVVMGDLNVAATVTGDDTYDLQWLDATVVADILSFNDIQMGIRVWYSI